MTRHLIACATLAALGIAATTLVVAQQDTRNPSIEAAAGSVVFIRTFYLLEDGKEVPFRTGTGVVIDRQGIVLTAYHMFKPDNPKLRVVATGSIGSRDGHRYTLTLNPQLGNPEVTDLAIARFSPSLPTDLWKPMRCGDSKADSDGDPLWVIGFPLNLDRRVQYGIRSGCEHIPGLCETSASVQEGYSGGPVINRYGDMIGVLLGTLGPNQMNAYRPVYSVRSMIQDSGAACFAEKAIAETRPPVPPPTVVPPPVVQEVAAIAKRSGTVAHEPLVVDGNRRLDATVLVYNEVIFRPGGRLILPKPRDGSKVVIVAKRITIQDPKIPAIITWDSPEEAQAGADTLGTGGPGSNGRSEGQNGENGMPGARGGNGVDGLNAPTMAVVVGEIRGEAGVIIELVGQAGGRGGNGQTGGQGGDGARGRPASQSAFDCRRGPGQGGNGGNGGVGGTGGEGGDGGTGGHLLFIDGMERPDAFELLVRIRLAGGDGGAPGMGGSPGRAGRAGPEGEVAKPFCGSAGRNGRGGSPGQEGKPGDPGTGGAPGEVTRMRVTQGQLSAFF